MDADVVRVGTGTGVFADVGGGVRVGVLLGGGGGGPPYFRLGATTGGVTTGSANPFKVGGPPRLGGGIAPAAMVAW